MKVFYIFIILQIARVSVKATPLGAPISACSNMTPNHGGSAQDNSASPYFFAVSSNVVQPGDTVTVTLNSVNGEQFRGIFLQARATPTGDPIGTWNVPNLDYQTRDCGGSTQSALTHTNANDKNSGATFVWNVPESSLSENVAIYGSVVREYSTYYVMLPTTGISIMSVPVTTTSPAATPAPSTSPGPNTTLGTSRPITTTGSFTTSPPFTTTTETTSSPPPRPSNNQCFAEYREAFEQWREVFQEYTATVNRWNNNENCYN